MAQKETKAVEQETSTPSTSTENGTSTGELFEIPITPKKKESNTITFQEASDAGWSPEEIDMGKEQGLLQDPEKKEEVDQKKEEGKEEPVTEEPKKEEDKKPVLTKKESSFEDFRLTDDEEKILAERLDNDPSLSAKLKNVAAQYWGRKQATHRAQAAEAERDRILNENKSLKDRMKKLEDKIDTGLIAKENQDGAEEEERPLTKKELKEFMEKQKEAEKQEVQRSQEEQQELAKKIREALKIQVNHAKSLYRDYDAVVALGTKLVERDRETGEFKNTVNLSTIPDHARNKAQLILKRIQNSAVRADEFTTSDADNAAQLSYDLGKLAAEFIDTDTTSSTATDTQASQSAERNAGGLTPEDEERIRKNKSRASSASISGAAGRRTISVEDVTIEDLTAMDSVTFDAFQKKYPDRVDQLMRG